MTTVPIGPWRPDVAALSSKYSSDMANVLYGDGVMIPVPAFMSFSQAVSAQPLGGITVRKDGLVHIFVGTANTIWKYENSTNGWTPVSQLGADQATNGAFGTDSGWTKDTNVTISGGEAHFTAVADGDGLSQSQSLTEDIIYKVTYTVSDYSAGAVKPIFTGGTQVDGAEVSSNGTHTDYLTAVSGNDTLEFQAVGTTTLDIDDVSIEPMDAYSASISQRWRFKKFGDFVVAVNINDSPQVFEVGTDTEFADLAGSPPNAHNLAVWGGDHLALFAGATVTWSDTNDIGEWSTGNSGSQTFPDGGDIQGSFDATNPIIVQREAIRAATFYPGSLEVFTFTKLHSKRGAISPYAVATRGEFLFFADVSAFYQLTMQGQVLPVGFEKVDRYAFGLTGSNDPGSVYCEVDPVRPRVYYAVKAGNLGADTFDQVLVHDWQIGEWSRIETTLDILFPLASGSPGFDLDTDVPDDAEDEFLDNDAPSLDSALYDAGAPLMAAFDANFKLGFFNGSNAEARVETAEMGALTSRLTYLDGAFPLVDTNNATLEVGTRMKRGDSVSYGTPISPNTETGQFDFRSESRFHKFRLTIPAGETWSFLQGIDLPEQGAGWR